MARSVLTTVRFTLPEGVESNAGLESLGAVLGHDRGRLTVTWRVDLRQTRVSALASAITRYVDLGDDILRRRIWPTEDLDTPLAQQLDALFDNRHQRHLAVGFYLTGTGWAQCVAASPAGVVTTTASYLEHALGDLVDLALSAIEQGEGTCRFAEEPGEYRWVYRDGQLRILSFATLYSTRPDDEGQVLYDAEHTAWELGRAVLAAASAADWRYGDESWLELWVEHPFPHDGVARLKAHLTQVG